MREPFPLQWPEGWARTKDEDRARSRFAVSTIVAARGLRRELERMGARNIVITSDLPVRRDGNPYGTGREPLDPGIAVYWTDGHHNDRVMACDRWDLVRDNLHAIELSVAALRGIERWGASQMVERAFSGFAALPAGDGSEVVPPPPPRPPRTWREVLDMAAGPLRELSKLEQLALAKARHRARIQENHPDRGGDHAVAAELNAAMAEAEAAPASARSAAGCRPAIP